jgi:hypothetical protein
MDFPDNGEMKSVLTFIVWPQTEAADTVNKMTVIHDFLRYTIRTHFAALLLFYCC